MKSWWAAVSRDYFSFTKRERTAVIILVFLGLLFYLVPRFLPAKQKPLADSAFMEEIARLKIVVDTTQGYRSYAKEEEEERTHYRPYAAYEKKDRELFLFDPNTLDKDGWARLGLRDKTIQTIHNFLSKGYRFHQPGDIKRIYGLHPKEAERLIPYIRISANEGSAALVKPAAAPSHREAVSKGVSAIDINRADTSAFIALKGIGSKLANRIINFREKLGGFVSVDQVGETYGLADTTFEKVRSLLQCNGFNVQTININTADATILKSHPYIKWNIANAIVNYRLQHGPYKSVDEITHINIIPENIYRKIVPYLTVE